MWIAGAATAGVAAGGTLYSLSKKKTDRYTVAPQPVRHKFKVIPCIPNGHCFFEAIGVQIGVGASLVRKGCVTEYKNSTTEVQEMMAIAEGVTKKEYERALSGYLMGGHNEMILATNQFNIDIHVYTRSHDSFKLVQTVKSKNREFRPITVRLLWNKVNHYDALVVT